MTDSDDYSDDDGGDRVLDNALYQIKAGSAGNDTPRAVVPTMISIKIQDLIRISKIKYQQDIQWIIE